VEYECLLQKTDASHNVVYIGFLKILYTSFLILRNKNLFKKQRKRNSLCQSWVVFSKILMRIGIVGRLIRGAGSEEFAAHLTVYVVVCSAVCGEVGCFVD